MTYSAKDLERASNLWTWSSNLYGVKEVAPTRKDIAALIATVRREALEDAAEAADQRWRTWQGIRSLEFTYRARAAENIAFDIRALKDGAP